MNWDQWLNEVERLDAQLSNGENIDHRDWVQTRAALFAKKPNQAASPYHLPRVCQAFERGQTILERLAQDREASRNAAESLYRALHLTQAARFGA